MAGAPQGNRNAVKENRIVSDELRKVLAQNRERVRKAWEKVLEKAEAGDLCALKELGDRSEGKPVQAISGPDGGAIVVEQWKLAPLGRPDDSGNDPAS